MNACCQRYLLSFRAFHAQPVDNVRSARGQHPYQRPSMLPAASSGRRGTWLLLRAMAVAKPSAILIRNQPYRTGTFPTFGVTMGSRRARAVTERQPASHLMRRSAGDMIGGSCERPVTNQRRLKSIGRCHYHALLMSSPQQQHRPSASGVRQRHLEIGIPEIPPLNNPWGERYST